MKASSEKDRTHQAVAARYTRLRDFGAFQPDIAALATCEIIAVKREVTDIAALATCAVAAVNGGSLQAGSVERKDQVEQAEQRGTRKGSRKKQLSILIRVGLTLLLFALLFKSLSWSSLFELLGNVRRALVSMGLIIGAAGVVISSYLSHFLPTGMGGDAIKAMYVGRKAGNTGGAASAVVMSRVTGFFGMLAIATVILIVEYAHFSRTLVLEFVLLSLLVGGMMCGALLSVTLLPRMLPGKWSRLVQWRVFLSITRVGDALRASATRPRSLAIATLFGVLFWITACLNYYSYAIAIGVSVPLYFYFVAIPFVSLVTFLPISINGFGVRESAFVSLFATMHISAASSLLIVLLMDAQVIFFGVLGGCIYFMLNRKKTLQQGIL
ncbi:MAG: flippase-like domain-containing protein [Chloroflexi bacterium]|nr:MAG: flippase-like domain-containing protein [Chloroflexota bacterium]